MATATSSPPRLVTPRLAAVLRTTAVVCVAATLALEFAHALELLPKMRYAAPLYVDVNHTLYAGYAVVGGVAEVVGIVATLALAVSLRRHPSRGAAVVAAVGALLALAVWVALVVPANAEMGTWTHTFVPPDWQRWRAQWEITHAACILPLSVALVALRQVRIRIEGQR